MKKKSIEFSLKAKKQEFHIEKIISSNDAYEYARKFYFDDLLIYESAFIILLNMRNNTIGYAKISQGGVSSTIVDAKIVAKYAIESLSSGVILVHNHPSGELRPSKEDDNLTKRIKMALEFFEIKLIDHLIITDKGFYSYVDEGKI